MFLKRNQSKWQQTVTLSKILAKVLLVAAILLFVLNFQKPEKSVTDSSLKKQTRKIYVIGHRGAAGLAPENTLAAFRRACQIEVDAVELDVLLSADQIVVVHHDFSLKPEIARAPEGQWLDYPSAPAIMDLTMAELKTYDVGRLKPNARYSRRYPEQQPADGERIPTLREVISLYKSECDKETKIWVEIKTSPEKPKMTPAPEIVALSFDWRVLVYVQKIAPDIPTVYLSHVGLRLNNIKPGRPGPSPWTAGIDVDDFNGSIPRAVKAAGGRYWAPHYNYVTIPILQDAQHLGIQVFVWTPDSPSDMKRLIKIGVDGIITNRPDILWSILGASK
jgi:glycerophosphoryl diester phosphodiesterase